MARECYFGVGKSNCLTYIPEDIKLELNNGTLTLKAGSKVYVPNGFTGESTETTITETYECFTSSFSGVVYYYYLKKPYKVGDFAYMEGDGKQTSSVDDLVVSEYYYIQSINTDGSLTMNISGADFATTITRYPAGDLTTTITEVIPSGTPIFDEVVISKDYTFSTAWNDKRMLFIRHNSDTDKYIDGYPVGQCHSGSTAPTGSQWMFWYDTSSNILKRTSDSGTTWDNYYSFPICIYNSDNGGITSIDQVFNGFGYIGSTVYALPGVKALIPDGLNQNGTYKSIEVTTSKVQIQTQAGPYVRNLRIDNKGDFTSSNAEIVYDNTGNKNYVNSVVTSLVKVGSCEWDSSHKITSLTPRAVQTKNTALKVNKVYLGTQNTNCLTHIPEDIKLELDENISNWAQPVLTSNGTMGGNSFAVNQSSVLGSVEGDGAWLAFDGKGSGTRWHSAKNLPQSIAWYNPKPLKITNVKVTNRSTDGSYPNAYQLQYSDDTINWTTTNSGNGTGGDSVSWNIAVTHTGFHKYWRLYITSATGSNSNYVAIGGIDITAQEKTSNLILNDDSKFYVPNGFKSDETTPKFDVVVTDVIHALDVLSLARNIEVTYFYNAMTGGFDYWASGGLINSGTTQKTTGGVFYNTTTNNIKIYSSDNVVYSDKVSLPLFTVVVDTNSNVNITNIFNGFGYIGSTLYALPGVKGLIPNGLTEKGTYKSIERIVDNVFTYTYPSTSIWTRSKQPLFIAKTGEQFSGTSNDNYFIGTDKSIYNNKTYVTFYDTRENIMYHAHATAGSWEDYNCFFVGYVGMELGKITSLTPNPIQPETTGHKINFIYKGSTMLYSDIPTKTFNASSSLQTYVVPNGVTKLHVDCVASQGGNSGGLGGRVQCDLNVTPGDTLYIMVGAVPSSTYTASYNASDIRIGGTEYSNRVVVAGGGGSKSSRGQAGGAGGGLTGADGTKGYGANSMGKGGTQTAGGAGGAGTPVSTGHYHNGGAGTFGLGGTGSHDSSYEGDAGAGGAGWYGGGAGAGDHNKNGDYVAGGGGGSSYTNSSLCSNVTHTQGYRSGAGYITISLGM